jgi:hypothetical protein
MRAAIEGTNSALKRGHELDKLKVRGFVKCNMVVGFKVLAHNFKRFANYMIEQSKKITPQDTGISLPILSQLMVKSSGFKPTKGKRHRKW